MPTKTTRRPGRKRSGSISPILPSRGLKPQISERTAARCPWRCGQSRIGTIIGPADRLQLRLPSKPSGRWLRSHRRREARDRIGDEASSTPTVCRSARPGAGRGEATVVFGRNGAAALGGPQKDGAVAAALLFGHLEAGASPPGASSRDADCVTRGSRRKRSRSPVPAHVNRGSSANHLGSAGVGKRPAQVPSWSAAVERSSISIRGSALSAAVSRMTRPFIHSRWGNRSSTVLRDRRRPSVTTKSSSTTTITT